jgi:hypothetical protein
MIGRTLNGVKFARLKDKNILGLDKKKTMMGLTI